MTDVKHTDDMTCCDPDATPVAPLDDATRSALRTYMQDLDAACAAILDAEDAAEATIEPESPHVAVDVENHQVFGPYDTLDAAVAAIAAADFTVDEYGNVPMTLADLIDAGWEFLPLQTTS